MSYIPFKEVREEITREHILEALKEMKANGIENYAPATGFDLKYKGDRYPPKEVIREVVCVVRHVKEGDIIEGLSGGRPANSFLMEKGFKIYMKDTDVEYEVGMKAWTLGEKRKHQDPNSIQNVGNKMTKKQLVESNGAEFVNPHAWSFINKKEKIILFGVWKDKDVAKGTKQLILQEDWQWSDKKKKNGTPKKQGNYKQAKEHIDLISSGEYKLRTFVMERIQAVGPNEKSTTKNIFPETMAFKALPKPEKTTDGHLAWYAVPLSGENSEAASHRNSTQTNPNNNTTTNAKNEAYEGEQTERTVMFRTRDRQLAETRKKQDSYTCKGCNFYYDDAIVECHHLVPVSSKDAATTKMEDLITLCPNCHRMAHHLISNKGNKYTDRNTLIKELKKIHGNI